MRVFWTILLVLAALGGAFLVRAVRMTARATVAREVRDREEQAKRTELRAVAASEVAEKERMAVQSTIAAESNVATKPTDAAVAGSGQAAEPRMTEKVGSTAPAAAEIKKDLMNSSAGEFAVPAESKEAGAAAAGKAGGSGGGQAGGDGKTDPTTFEIEPSKIEQRDDGTMLVDDKFVVKGDGSVEKPYEVTWEHLVSAEKTYDPKNKKKKVPQSIAMLDGKYIKLAGYVAFPLMIQTPKECLVMLNQWDGCCIGVPPTPYDAIEARLGKAVTGEDRYATSGSIIGKLGIKPYVVGDWLVGLYLLEDGRLDTKAFGGFGGS